jgi:hypothetical protein
MFMATSFWNRIFKPKSGPPVRRRRPGGARPRVEELEARLQPSALSQPAGFFFSTGLPDGKVATISQPSSAQTNHVEFESADDFVLTTETVIDHASFTGLLTGGATPADVSNVILEIYRVFPNDSDVGRTSGPPTFSTPQVPTRVNSPADNALESFNSTAGDLSFRPDLLSPSFTAQSSVSSPDQISLHSGGNGPVTGEEVQFDVKFNTPLDLPAGHYFFVPQVGLTDTTPAADHFLWLSAPKPIAPPGTPFPPGATDLQSWMRFDPGLAPDWLRIGTDIIGGTTFNGTFSLAGHTVPPHVTSLGQTSVAEGSPALTLTINGSNFTPQSAVVSNGLQPLKTTFVSPNQLQVVIPAAFLAEEGHFQLSVLDAENGLSNAVRFTVTDSDPALTAEGELGQTVRQSKPNGGDGAMRVPDLGDSPDAPFSVTDTFAKPGHAHHDAIVVTALDDGGVAGASRTFDVTV